MSVTKFTPDTFGGTVDPIYNSGTLSAGDDRIRVLPARVKIHANSFNTVRVSVASGLPVHTVVQGWINLDDNRGNDLHFAYYAQIGAPQ